MLGKPWKLKRGTKHPNVSGTARSQGGQVLWARESRGFRRHMSSRQKEKKTKHQQKELGGGFKYFLFSPLFGEDSHFD